MLDLYQWESTTWLKTGTDCVGNENKSLETARLNFFKGIPLFDVYVSYKGFYFYHVN